MPIGKTSTLPPIRVNPSFKHDIENVLKKDETLSSFVEESVKIQVQRRQIKNDFLKTAMIALEEAEETNHYISHEELISSLKDKLEKAKKARNIQR